MTETIYLCISTVIAMLSLFVTIIISLNQIRRSSHEAMMMNRISVFAEYTRRYHDLILNMPPEMLGDDKLGKSKYLRLYFDLCSEEHHLFVQKLVPEDIWDNWCKGMQGRMKSQVFQDGWEHLQAEYNTSFVNFMNKQILLT